MIINQLLMCNKLSFLIGMGSVLNPFKPMVNLDTEIDSQRADRLSIESDFNVIGKDIAKAIQCYANASI